MDSIVDPRNPKKRQDKYSQGRNADSFDPKTTLCRPDMRVRIETNTKIYPHPIKSDDVIITPNFEVRADLYEKLVYEMKDLQNRHVKDSDYISWACGTHLLVKNPDESQTFQYIINRICDYYSVDPKTISVRFNMYKDDVDWKSLHHDSAAFNKQRAEKQNITIGLSLGKTRELAFKHAKNNTLVYMPMPNGSLYSFSKAVNIQWLHGINAIPKEDQTSEGRISIIVWGFTSKLVEEPNEPKILQDNDRRPPIRKLSNEMVMKELRNFADGSNKISAFSLIQRVSQCEDKKELVKFALSIIRFNERELNKLRLLQ